MSEPEHIGTVLNRVMNQIEFNYNQKRTQLDVIRDHLESFGSITSWDCISRYRITRLSAHIETLRKEGLNITTTWKTTHEGKHYGLYELVKH